MAGQFNSATIDLMDFIAATFQRGKALELRGQITGQIKGNLGFKIYATKFYSISYTTLNDSTPKPVKS